MRETRDNPFRTYLMVVWRRGVTIVVCTFGLGVIAFVVTRFMPTWYDASATLVVETSKPGTTGAATYENVMVATNHTIAAKVIAELHLDGPPYNVNAADALDKAIIVRDVRNTSLIRVTGRLKDPEMAATLANRFAEAAVELKQKLHSEQTADMVETLKAKRDAAEAAMKSIERQLLDYQKRSQLERRKEDYQALTDRRRGMPDILMQLGTKKARLAAVERELQARPPAGAAARDPAAGADSAHLRLEQELPVLRVDIEELDWQRQEYARLDRLQAEARPAVRQGEARLENLQFAYNSAKRTFSGADSQYEDAKGQVLLSSRLKLIDKAIPPKAPSSPPTGFAVLGAMTLGFILSLTISVLTAQMPARSSPAAAPPQQVV